VHARLSCTKLWPGAVLFERDKVMVCTIRVICGYTLIIFYLDDHPF
jgi:hypothetical protein